MRRLSDHDIKLWRKVAVSVRPFPGRVVPPAPPEAPEDGPVARQPAAGRITVGGRSVAEPTRTSPQPLADVSNTRKVRRGQTPVDARLDLHGHTQDSAYLALLGFIERNRAHGAHTVLVITGKGRAGGGILRTRFFDWIEGPEIRPLLAGYSQAHPRHGGAGAFYLVLKARRPLEPDPRLDAPTRKR